jgi:hypothetical protein
VNLLPDSFNLADAISTANDKIVGKGANLPGIKHNNIVSLFIRSRLHRPPRYFYRFQNSLLQANLTRNYFDIILYHTLQMLTEQCHTPINTPRKPPKM